MTMDRRRFIELTAGAMGVTAFQGCASVVMTTVASRNGTIVLALIDHPQLAQPGGYLRVQPEGFSSPVYVLAIEQGGYIALSPICTHLGCTVGIEGPLLVCPCHGSTYDRVGRVLRGPAERSLRQFPLAMSPDGELVIRLSDP